jgi:hypothetical protein
MSIVDTGRFWEILVIPVLQILEERGAYKLRPSEHKYCKTWDVSNVLGYLRKLSLIKFISLKDLTLKVNLKILKLGLKLGILN